MIAKSFYLNSNLIIFKSSQHSHAQEKMTQKLSSLFSFNNKNKQVDVTVIIAAYMRSDVLNDALKSLYRQSFTSWNAIVIGDCCDEYFESQIDLSDSRIQYINLSERCGNQYGPNSLGMYIANTKYIAYLNHDDLWLTDHLEQAVTTLEKNSLDFFLGKAAFCHPENQLKSCEEKGRLVFSELNQPEAIWRCFPGPFYLFEPISSWVVRTKFAKKIGYWTTPDSSTKTPVMDWIQRAAQAGTTFCFSNSPTVLKLCNHWGMSHDHPNYFRPDQFASYVKPYLELPAEDIRRLIKEDLKEAPSKGLKVRDFLDKPIELSAEEMKFKKAFKIFIETGKTDHNIWDESVNYKTFAINAIKRRTGESIHTFPPAEEIISRYLSDEKYSR